MKRARKQVTEQVRTVAAAPEGAYYNIYYNRWSGGDTHRYTREKAKTRCKVATDAGETKGSKDPGSCFCLYFARGCCPNGFDCRYWHRTPKADEVMEITRDCFGRERFAQNRDDMGGVGSFQRDNRTLYVGGVGTYHNTEEVVVRHFQEWGDIETVKLLKTKPVAFVTYASRLQAEFAKEAMSGQSLDKNEILNVRWATEDPYKNQKEELKRKVEEMARQSDQQLALAGYVGDEQGAPNKRAREGDHYSSEYYAEYAGYDPSQAQGQDPYAQQGYYYDPQSGYYYDSQGYYYDPNYFHGYDQQQQQTEEQHEGAQEPTEENSTSNEHGDAEPSEEKPANEGNGEEAEQPSQPESPKSTAVSGNGIFPSEFLTNLKKAPVKLTTKSTEKDDEDEKDE
ncbi:uncharacterized protein VTP21DRAFT_11020 [Calcarisporiella thermophila]|uniref:uncharacterized protein n=1 Tax=Calcarisporiella thermophila TaxID=911321 RepID=UPI0037441FF4